jgi:hypothetical protein
LTQEKREIVSGVDRDESGGGFPKEMKSRALTRTPMGRLTIQR